MKLSLKIIIRSILIALVVITTASFTNLVGSTQSNTPDNISWIEKTVTVDGKNYRLSYVEIDTIKKPVEIGLAFAKQRMWYRDDPDNIARYVGATAAINGPFHNESGGWSNYLFDSTIVRDTKAIRIYNSGSQFCITNSGNWYFGRLRFKMMGAVEEDLLPPSLKTIHVSGLNQPTSTNSTVLYTDDWNYYTPKDSVNVVIQGGVVTDIVTGQYMVPTGAYVLCYTGTNRERTYAWRWPQGYLREGLHINIYWAPTEHNEVDLSKWRDSKFIFGGSPTLVMYGKPYWNPGGENHKNWQALNCTARRTAFGIDGEGKAYMVNFLDSVKVQEMGKVLVEIGVNYAFNLDGGCSTYLWYDGQERISNCRDLPGILYVKPKEE
jgi:exopolysaccharide biosynthesis protein